MKNPLLQDISSFEVDRVRRVFRGGGSYYRARNAWVFGREQGLSRHTIKYQSFRLFRTEEKL